MGVSYQLYKLSEAYEELMDRLAEQEGELSEEDEQELNQLIEQDLPNAITQAYMAIKNIKATNAGLKEERDLLDKRIKRYDKITERIQESLKSCLIRTGHADGKTYGKDGHYCFFTHTHPVEINEEVMMSGIKDKVNSFVASLPDYYRVSVSVNKTEVGKRIDAGEEFDFASKGENLNIQIK